MIDSAMLARIVIQMGEPSPSLELARVIWKEAFNAGIEAAAKCYSPDDSANDWMDKIRALEKAK